MNHRYFINVWGINLSSREIAYMYSCSPLNSGYPVMPLNPFLSPPEMFYVSFNKPQKNCASGNFWVKEYLRSHFCVEGPCCKHVGDPQDSCLLPLAQHHTSANLGSFREADLWRPHRQPTVVERMISRLSELRPTACSLLTAFVSSGDLLSLYVSQFPLLCCNMRI